MFTLPVELFDSNNSRQALIPVRPGLLRRNFACVNLQRFMYNQPCEFMTHLGREGEISVHVEKVELHWRNLNSNYTKIRRKARRSWVCNPFPTGSSSQKSAQVPRKSPYEKNCVRDPKIFSPKIRENFGEELIFICNFTCRSRYNRSSLSRDMEIFEIPLSSFEIPYGSHSGRVFSHNLTRKSDVIFSAGLCTQSVRAMCRCKIDSHTKIHSCK